MYHDRPTPRLTDRLRAPAPLRRADGCDPTGRSPETPGATDRPLPADRSVLSHLRRLGASIRDRVAIPGVVRTHRFGHDHEDAETATDVEADVLAAVRERARAVHERLAHDHGVHCVEFAGSTGGGKTSLLERLIERAPDDEEIGVIVGDVAGEDDAKRLRALGVPVETVNTGKECHLDPTVVGDALDAFDLDALDTLYLENVGNMVCPADFPLGATCRALVVSTTEGEDVVRKHPMLVQSADVVAINKVDIAAAVGTDVGRIRGDVAEVAPGTPVVETDGRHGEGIDDLASALESADGHAGGLHADGHDHDGHGHGVYVHHGADHGAADHGGDGHVTGDHAIEDRGRDGHTDGSR